MALTRVIAAVAAALLIITLGCPKATITGAGGPIAVADFYTTNGNTVLVVGVVANGLLANDSHDDAAEVVFLAVIPLADADTTEGGTVTVALDGTFTYTPPADFSGEDTFTYAAIDRDFIFETATVTITVTATPPAAVDDGFMALQDTQLVVNVATGILANDTVADATITDPATGTGVATAQGGTITIAADGSFTYDPAAAFTGQDTIDYTLTNAFGTDTATITIDVQRAPVGVADTYSTPAGVTLNVPAGAGPPDGLLVNDDAGVPAGTVTAFGGGDLGGAVGDNAGGDTVTPLPSFSDGSLTVNADGSLTFVPATGQNGTFDFQYRVQNTAGFDDVDVTIGIPEAPTAVDDPGYMAVTAMELSVNAGSGVLANDDPGFPTGVVVTTFGGGSLGGSVSDNAAGTTANFGAGSLTVNADGSFTFTSDAGFTGDFTFEYEIDNTTGTDTATVTIDVQMLPVANDDSYEMLDTDGTLNIGAGTGLLDNDMGTPTPVVASFGGGDLGGDETTNTAGSTVNFGTSGSITVNADGSFDFTPDTGFTGNFAFDYQISNAFGTDTATVTIAVEQVPAAVDDGTYMAVVDVELQVMTSDPNDLLDNDTPGFPAAQIVSFGGGSLGDMVTSNPVGSPRAFDFGGGQTGTLTINADGSFTFESTGFTGTFTVLYRLENEAGPGAGPSTADATITIDADAIPGAVDDPDGGLAGDSSPGETFHIATGGTLTHASGNGANLLANDELGDPTGSITFFGGGSLTGAVTDNAAGNTVSPLPGYTDGSLTVSSDGTFSFTAPTLATPFVGVFTFQYRLDNGVGNTDATVSIGVGNRPEGTNDAHDVLGNVSIDTSTGTAFSVLTNDTGDALSVTGFDATSTNGGNVSVSANGEFTYDPPAGHTGADSFSYTLENGFGTDTGTVNLTVTDLIWFIDDTATPGGDGRLSEPFDSIAAYNVGAASETGDIIFVQHNSGSYTTAPMLLDNQQIIGSGATGTNLQTLAGVTLPAHSATLPAINGTRPTISATLTVAANNVVIGTDIAGLIGIGVGALVVDDCNVTTGGITLLGSSGSADLTFGSVSGPILLDDLDMGDLEITTLNTSSLAAANSDGSMLDFGAVTVNVTGTGTGVSLSTLVTGTTVTFSSLNVTTADGIAFQASDCDSVAIGGGANSLDATGGAALVSTGSTMPSGTWSFSSITSTNSIALGIELAGALNLSVTTTTITNPASDGIQISSPTGSASFGTTTITSRGAEGICISGATSPTINFGTTNVTNDNSVTSDGVLINGLTGGSVTFSSLTIANNGQSGRCLFANSANCSLTVSGGTLSGSTSATGTADFSGGNATVNFDASIDSDAGRALRIASRSGGTMTFNGTIDADGAEGISISGASSAATTVFNQVVRLGQNTRLSGAGVAINHNGTASTTQFNNSVLVTSSGTGYSVSNGGTLRQGVSGSTIDTDGASALVIDGSTNAVTIGTGGVFFNSVTGANLAGNRGIHLTNVTGSLTLNVTGATTLTGGDGTVPTMDIQSVSCPVAFIGAGGGITLSAGSSPALQMGTVSTASSGGTGTFTFNGPINRSGTGRSLEIAERSAGSANFGGLITDTGTGIRLINNTGGTVNLQGGLNLDQAGGTSFTATGGGTINVNTGTADITNTAGQALDLSSITAGITLATAISTAGTHGVDCNTVAGSVSITTTTVTNSTSDGILIDASTGTFSFGALNITNTTSNQRGLVSTGGTPTVNTTSGAINCGANAGVNLNGATLGITLTSVTTNSGPTAGIQLTNTTGSFTVIGDGVDTSEGGNSSGGTIANVATGILLTNATNVTLRRMQLNDFTAFAISGTTVSTFNMEYCTVSGTSGDAVNEGAVYFTGLTGSATFTECAISGGAEHNIRIANSSGTLNRITFNGGTIGQNQNNGIALDGLHLAATSTATLNATITDVSFTGARDDLLQTTCNDQASMDLIVRDNTFANAHPETNRGGVEIDGTGTGAGILVTYLIEGTTPGDQTSTGTGGTAGSGPPALNLSFAGTGTASGTVRNNTIGQTGVPGSGSGGSGIRLGSDGTLTHSVLLDTNDIRRFDLTGIETAARGDSRLNVELRSNVVAEADINALAAMDAVLANAGSGAAVLDVLFPDSTAPNVINAGAFTIGWYIVQNSSGARLNLPGYTGATSSPTCDADIDTYLSNRGHTATGMPNVLSAGVTGITNNAYMTMRATQCGPQTDAPAPAQLALQQVLAQAVADWAAMPVSPAQREALGRVRIRAERLGGDVLGTIDGETVVVDADAAGVGWQLPGDPADADAPRYDLLTVVRHELGHILGLPDTFAGRDAGTLMYARLEPGERREVVVSPTALAVAGR